MCLYHFLWTELKQKEIPSPQSSYFFFAAPLYNFQRWLLLVQGELPTTPGQQGFLLHRRFCFGGEDRGRRWSQCPRPWLGHCFQLQPHYLRLWNFWLLGSLSSRGLHHLGGEYEPKYKCRGGKHKSSWSGALGENWSLCLTYRVSAATELNCWT